MYTILKPYYPHYKSLTQLGLPIIIGQIGTIILGLADTLMIGQHSTTELGAAAFVNNMFVLVLVFGLGFAYGLTPIVGSLYAREENNKIGGMLKNALLVNTLLAVLLVAAMFLLYLNLDKLGQPEELLPLMRPYFIVNLISLPFFCWFNTFKQLFDGTTDTKIPMWIMLGGNVFNIVGNYVLIYGKLGFPELGLYGAGISTMTSRILMAIVITIIFFASKRYNIYHHGFLKQSINRADLIFFLRIGFPLSLQMSMETAAFSLSSIMVGWIGTKALAAHQVMLSISQLFYMVYYGMGAAIAIRVSYFMGQRDYKAVQLSSSAGFHLIMLIAFIVAIPVFIYRNQMGALFTDSEDVCQMVAQLIWPLMIYQIGDGLQCAYGNAMRGLSYVKPLVPTAFVAFFLISLPMGFLLGIKLNFGIQGIWYAFPFGLTTAGMFYHYFFRKELNKLSSSKEAILPE